MRQLMGNQPLALVCPRSEPTQIKHNVMPHGVRIGVHVSRRLLGCCARMHPHPRKIVTKVLFHVLPKRRVQWFTRAGEDMAYASGRCLTPPGHLPCVALDARWRAANVGTPRHRQHLLRNSVRFLFQRITGLAYLRHRHGACIARRAPRTTAAARAVCRALYRPSDPWAGGSGDLGHRSRRRSASIESVLHHLFRVGLLGLVTLRGAGFGDGAAGRRFAALAGPGTTGALVALNTSRRFN